MKLVSHNYGKQHVRVMKVLRGSPRQEVKELEVGIRLEGDFAAAYVAGDNRLVVPADTIKNVVQVLAHHHLGSQTEPFGLLLAQHFLKSYPQVLRVTVEIRERRWLRLAVDGRPHDHAFTGDGARPVARVHAVRGGTTELESGVEGLLIMKSAGAGFSDYPKDSYTILRETGDQILATELRARWLHAAAPADYAAANAAILDTMLKVFAAKFSPSGQKTLFDMASAALTAHAGIARVSLSLPNQPYLPANLEPFDLENPNVTFVPADEPHGLIEAVVSRVK